MRVLDNLENYDIPSGFHLTAEQEEQLAADLKEIVLALIPLRSSKLKTRQYFSHLSSPHILRLLAAARPQVVSKSVVVREKRVFEKTKAVIVFSAKCWTKCPLSASIQKFIKKAYYEIFQ